MSKNYSELLKDELKDELDSREIEYSSGDTKDDLIALLEENDSNNVEEVESSDSSNDKVMVRYIGRAKRATRYGEITNEFYIFEKENGTPLPTEVDKQDVNFLLAEKGKSCCGRAPFTLFILDSEFEEINCN